MRSQHAAYLARLFDKNLPAVTDEDLMMFSAQPMRQAKRNNSRPVVVERKQGRKASVSTIVVRSR